MAIIKKDEYGLNVQAGGYNARPVQVSIFVEGDKVDTHHFGGTIKAGVGKNQSCKHGEYLETWCTNGNSDDPKTIAWYKAEFVNQYSNLCKNAILSEGEKSIYADYDI